MIKTTYQSISNHHFQIAVQKICSAPTDAVTAYKINKISGELKKLKLQIQAEYHTEVMDPHAKRDEKGEYDKQNFMPDESKIGEFQKANEAFGLKEASMPRHKLTLREIKDVKLSADELGALEPILDDSEGETLGQRPGQTSLKIA
jgi:hypothetical protein